MRLLIEIEVRFGEFVLSVNESLTLDGVTALFGPSGSGKTTLLRCIAGLEPRAEGRIEADDQAWLDSKAGVSLPAHHRMAGMVFQQALLFPHLSVRKNLLYGWRRRGQRPGPDFSEVLDALRLAPLLEQRENELSGGEMQRVALGRVLLSAPRMLLLDEPLAAQDERRKAEILPYLKRTIREFQLPVVYVSHAVDEVMPMASRVLHMDSGRLQSSAAARVSGGTAFGAILLGATLQRQLDSRLAVFCVGNAEVIAFLDSDTPNAREVLLAVEPRDLVIATGKTDAPLNAGAMDCTVRSIGEDETSGNLVLELAAGSSSFRLEHSFARHSDTVLRVGQKIRVLLTQPARVASPIVQSGTGRDSA
ncbi:MAG: ATP-binding cassette domain-containing protein [Rhodobacteraceae bacterium]|nr:ATP-binding cassette domain-containing protein [Paracoccaceae bacterium]